jgi:hypothetical protein
MLGILLLLQGIGAAVFASLIGWMARADLLATASLLVLGIATVVGSIGLLRLRPWAWLMLMLVQGGALIVYLLDYVQGVADSFTRLSMFFSACVVFYLNQRDIRQLFQVAVHQRDVSGLRADEPRPELAEAAEFEAGPGRLDYERAGRGDHHAG